MRDVISLKSGNRTELSSGGFIAFVAVAAVLAFGAVFAVAFLGPTLAEHPQWQRLVSNIEDLVGPDKAEQPKPAPVRTAVSLSVRRTFKVCSGAARITCIAGGDSFWLDGMRIRVADIDAPDVSEPKCAAEAELGARATRRLAELLNAGPFELASGDGQDEDQHRRKLRLVSRDGRSIGAQLVSEGLARARPGPREPWC